MTTLRKFLSRKFLVFLVATVAFFMGVLPPEHWVGLAAVYAGIEGALDYGLSTRGNNASAKSRGNEPPDGTLL